MTARDLFTNNPPEKAESGAAHVGLQAGAAPAGTGQDRAAPAPLQDSSGSRARAFDGSIEWFAQEQARLRAAGEASAKAFHEARRSAQDGIDQAAAAAERWHQGWCELAFAFVKLYAIRNKGRQYIGHDIVQASISEGVFQPENPKAWGAPIQRAAREGVIKRVGYAPDPNRHTNPVPLWESA